MGPRLIACALLVASSAALAHDPVDWNGGTYLIVLSSEETDGKTGMFTVQVAEPGGPPLHVHDDADEYFFMIEGSARFQLAGESQDVQAGEVAYVPRGEEHTYRIVSEEGGRMLTIVAPGGFEGFFEAMAAEQLVIPDDMPRIQEIAKQFNMTFTGPPLQE